MGRMPSPPSTPIDALGAADRAGLADVLSEDVRVRRELRQDRETATFIEGAVGGRAVDGEITLMLRPLEALLEGVKR